MTCDPDTPATPTVKDVTEALYSQLMGVLGLKQPNWIARGLFPIFYIPILRASRLLVELDHNTARHGWNMAVDQLQRQLVNQLELHGEEHIPTQGPLMVICNHPAALDLPILLAAIKREDLKFLISDIPILQLFPHIFEHCIPVFYNIPMRLQTIHRAIQHLENDGALFLFPRGNVEPDPAVSPGAEQSLSGWSPSIELFLRRVPETISVVGIASGMLSAGWYKNPVIQLWKKYEQRQKVAEIFQIAAQMVTGKTPAVTPRVSFSDPIPISELGGEGVAEGALLAGLIARARKMLQDQPHVRFL